MTGNLHRFFVKPTQIVDGQVEILGSDARQIRTVLRLKVGDNLTAVDGSGMSYLAEIRELNKTCVRANVRSILPVDTEPEVHLTLAQGLPKGDKYALVIQKGTELGIGEYVGVSTSRSVVQAQDVSHKQARWLRIAKEAAEQCGRAKIPVVNGVVGLTEALTRVEDHDIALMAWEGESAALLTDVLRQNKDAKRVVLFVGPEGGFTPEEVDAAKHGGVTPVSLGKRVLRTETAAIAASVIILNELEGHL